MPLTVGSLFSGIGGIDLGLERCGMTVRWQVEIDEFCSQVLSRHWPDAARFRDVRAVGADCLAPVDLIAGGFPCQDISLAGKGAGIDGARSGLWHEYLRIVQAMRPAWVLVENVPALRTRGADTVLDGLEQAGYACWPLVVGARHVGAPHRRDRVWIVSRLAVSGQPGLEGRRRLPSGAGAEVPVPAGCGSPLAHADILRCELERSGRLLDGQRPAHRHDVDRCHRWPARPGEAQREWEESRTTQPPLGRATDGVSRRLARHRRDSLKALGNSVVPQIVEAIGRAILQCH